MVSIEAKKVRSTVVIIKKAHLKILLFSISVNSVSDNKGLDRLVGNDPDISAIHMPAHVLRASTR